MAIKNCRQWKFLFGWFQFNDKIYILTILMVGVKFQGTFINDVKCLIITTLDSQLAIQS